MSTELGRNCRLGELVVLLRRQESRAAVLERYFCESRNGAMTTDFYSDILASSGSYKFYLNGEWKESTSGKTVAILNPATNQTAYTVQGTIATNTQSLESFAFGL